MKTEIQVKIKRKDGKDIILDNDEAKELYEELSKIYGSKTEYIPFWWEKTYPTYPTYPPPIIWTSTKSNVEIMCQGNNTY